MKVLLVIFFLFAAYTVHAQDSIKVRQMFIDSLIITDGKIRLSARNAKTTVKQTKASTTLTIEPIYTDTSKTIVDTVINKLK